MKTIGVLFLLSFTFISCMSADEAVLRMRVYDVCITTVQDKESWINPMSKSEAERHCNCVMEVIDAEVGSFSETERKLNNMSSNEVGEFFQACQ